MAKQLLFALLLINSLNLFSQQIAIRKDMVYNNDEAYCKLLSIGTLTHQSYSIQNLTSKELIFIDQSGLRDAQGNALLRFMFTGMPDKEAFMPVSFNFKKIFARLLVGYKLIENNQLNPEGVDRFCRNYTGLIRGNRVYQASEMNLNTQNTTTYTKPENTTQVTLQPNNTNEIESSNTSPSVSKASVNYNLVKRDIQQPVFLSGQTIRQDFEDIGLYQSQLFTTPQGDYYLLSFRTIDDEPVAECKYDDKSSQCVVTTFSDKKTHNVQLNEDEKFPRIKEIIYYLIQQFYL